jgi:hypothetical protein
MTDQSQPTVDTSGIGRTTDGAIADGQTTQSDQGQSSQTTNQETGTTLLTDKGEQKTEPKADDADKKETKVDGAPEKYADYKLPEGLTLDGDTRSKADTLFKSLGLSQEGAQSLVDFYGEQISKTAAAPVEAYKTLTEGWKTESMDHPDLRGKLGQGQEVNVRISKALDGLGDPKLVSDFKALMDLTGAGNNQAFIRVLDKFAQRVSEGTHVAGNGPNKDGQSAPGSRTQPTAAAAMWPNLANR